MANYDRPLMCILFRSHSSKSVGLGHTFRRWDVICMDFLRAWGLEYGDPGTTRSLALDLIAQPQRAIIAAQPKPVKIGPRTQRQYLLPTRPS